jgi:hypothetical protein
MGAGEGVTVPAGVAHTFHNAGESEFGMFGEYRPGLPEQSNWFHDMYFALARALLRPIARLMGYRPFEEPQGTEHEGVRGPSVSR